MADSVPKFGTEGPSPNFHAYTAAQAQTYAHARPGHPCELYSYVLDHHLSTGGQLGTLLDVGCGTGQVIQDFAPYFDRAIGCDAGEQMIKAARAVGYPGKDGKDIKFEVCKAEDIGTLEGVEPGTVDVITCAMSAHWFDMFHFYPAAARLLKPNGSLVIWAYGGMFIHPDTPKATDIQEVITHLQEVIVNPSREPDRLHADQTFDELELPWEGGHPVCQHEFKADGFHRKVWNRDGRLEDGRADFLNGRVIPLEGIKKMMGTSSTVTRWMDANRLKLDKGEIRDPIEEAQEEILSKLDKGLDRKAEVTLAAGTTTGLLMFKRA